MEPFHVTYANTLRRAIIANVETVAFNADMTEAGTTSDVIIEKNDTPMTNEMLADRVGLLPLHVTQPLTWNPDKYLFSLDVTNTSEGLRDVVAADFVVKEVVEGEDEPRAVDSATFFVPDKVTRDTCLLAVLKPQGVGQPDGETVRLKARATVGNGRKHARYIPVSQCTYTYTRDTDPARMKASYENWLVKYKKINPKELEEGGDRSAALQREFNTMEAARCYIVDERGEPISFDFFVESVGVLGVPYIVQRACDVVEGMCLRYSNIGTGDVPDDVTIQPADASILGFDFVMKGHDHTFGNLIQTWIVEELITRAKDGRVTFAGYKVPHPLRDEMVLRIGVADGKEDTARAVLQDAARGCAAIFGKVRQEWMKGVGLGAGVPDAAVPRRVVTKESIMRARAAQAQAQEQAQVQE